MNTPEVLVLFGLVATLIIVIIVAYAWSHVTVRQAKDVTEQIESLPDNRRRRSREILDKVNEAKQQIAQNQTIVQSLITARDEARQRLAFMETKYKTMYENAGIGIARLDGTYQYIEVNRYYAQIYGYDSPDEFLERNPSFVNICPHFKNDSLHRDWHNTTSMLKNDCHHRTKTGEEIVVQNTFVPVVNDFGVIEFYDLFAENVTEEARIRQELEQSNVRLDAEARKRAEKIITMEREHARLYNTAPVGLYRAELKDGAFIFVNEYMAHMLGYKTIEDCLLHSMAEHYLDASDHDRFIIPFNESADTPTHRVTVCWKKAKSEHRVWLILTEVINFQQGYVEGVAVDVSNETIAQQELIRAKEQYRLVYERAPVGLYQIDAITGSFEMINNTMREILGYNSMMPTSDINMNEHIVGSLGEKRPISDQTVTYETEIITSSGETKWLGLTEILCENDSVYEGFAIDITKQKIAEQRLKKLYEDYMKMYKSAPVGLYTTRISTGEIIHMNEQFIKLLGYSTIDEIRKTQTSLQTYADPSQRQHLLHMAMSTPRMSYSQESQFIRKDGSLIWVLDGGYADIQNDLFEGFILDITEKKTYQAELEKSETLYRATIEHSRDWIYVTDATDDFNVILSNKANLDAQRLMGAPTDIIGKPLTYMLTKRGSVIKAIHEEVRRSRRPKYIMSFDGMVDGNGDGAYVIDITKVPILDDTGNCVAILTSLHDQTEQVSIERQLEHQRNEFMALYRNAPLGLFRINKETHVVEYANGQLASLLGYPDIETCCRCSLRDHIADLDMLLASESINKEHTVQITQSTGMVKIWVSFKVALDETKNFYDGYILDINDYKYVKDYLNDQTILYRTVFNAMKDWIMVLDKNLTVILSNTTNDEFARPGSGRLSCVGVHVTEAYPALSHEALDEYKFVLESKKEFHTERNEHIADTDYVVEVKKIPVLDAEGNVDKIVAVARDITRRRMIETKLAETNTNLSAQADQLSTQYRLIVDSSPIMLAVIRAGRISRVNNTFASVLGYTEEEVYVRNILEFVVPEYRHYFTAMRWDDEGLFRRELQIYANRMSEFVWVDVVVKQFVDTDGKNSQLCIMVDITDKKRAMNELVTLTTNMHKTFDDLQRTNLELQETHAMLQEAYAAQYDTSHKLDSVMKSISDTSFILDESGYVVDVISTRKHDVLFDSFIQHAKTTAVYKTHISAFFTDKYTVDHLLSTTKDALLYDRIQHLEFTSSTPVGQRSFMALLTPILGKRQAMISLRDSGEAKRLKGLCESVLSAFGALIRYTRKDDALKQSVDELVGRFDILAGTVSMIESDGNMATIYACGPQHDMEQAILQATNMMGGKMPIFQTVISGRQYLLFILRENNRFVGVLGFIMSDLWIPFSTDRIDDQELLSYYAESLTTFLTHRT